MRNKLYEIVLSAHTRFKVFKWGIGSYLKSEKGATAVEYALVIALVVTMVIAAAGFMFDPLKQFFVGVVDLIKQAAGISSGTGGGTTGGTGGGTP